MDAVRRAHQLKRENLQRGNEAHSALPTSNASSMSSPVAPTEPSHDDDMVTPFLTNGQRNYGSNTSNGTPPPRLPRSGTTLWRIARSKLLPTYNNSNYLLESKRTIKGLTVTLQRPTPCTSVINDDHMSCWAGCRNDFAVLAASVRSSYLSVLLICVPLGLLAYLLKWSPILVFSFNFLSLIPLALLLGEITEDLALRFGDVVGGLCNATFGNVVELLLSLAALSKGLYSVVAMSLIGSILSNLLLVLGCCFFFGGLRFSEQSFNALANKTSTSLLFMACLGVTIPTASHHLYSHHVMTENDNLQLSRLVALVLALVYCCYLFFQLKTHAHAFSSEDEGEEPSLSMLGAVAGLTGCTVVVAMCSEFLTGSLEAVAHHTGLSPDFLGLIVLPIAGNACEHLTAVYVAGASWVYVHRHGGHHCRYASTVKGKMDVAIGISLGSSLQIALFVIPFIVLVGWGMGRPMSLNFDPFATLVLTLAVINTQFASSDSRSNWLLGLQLIATYCLIAFVFYYVHTKQDALGVVASTVVSAVGAL